jgi:cellulose synthase/poly-beta-1,6-N-acetylglucosamine synthase-like glycosyltransferase
MEIVALIPAHNEERLIGTAISALKSQSTPPTRIVLVADNCTDGTVGIGREHGVEVFETRGNSDKKAGALNQALASVLPGLEGQDVVFIQDADSILSTDFLANALRRLMADDTLGAVGGVFSGGPGGGFVGHLQRNEYARYARDVARLNGKCLVVTGTAATFRVRTLRAVSAGRLDGTLPPGDGRGGVYDTTVLTEDNEISFALLTLGYRILSPKDCTLETEVMPTWTDLWKQRLRWKRGAVENCFQYGLTKVTWRYWGRQALTLAGVIVTFLYLGTLIAAALSGGITVQPFWAAVTGVFVVERIVTVRYRGWRYMLAAATMYELVIDLFLQLVHARAYFDALTKRKRVW